MSDTSDKIVAMLFKHIDMPQGDLMWLLNRVEDSESAKSAVNNLVLKLKLEFGVELAELRQNEAKARAAQETHAELVYQKRLSEYEVACKSFDANIERFDKEYAQITKLIEKGLQPFYLPEHLRKMYTYLFDTKQVWVSFFGRVHFDYSRKVDNPYRQEQTDYALFYRPHKGDHLSMLGLGWGIGRDFRKPRNPGY